MRAAWRRWYPRRIIHTDRGETSADLRRQHYRAARDKSSSNFDRWLARRNNRGSSNYRRTIPPQCAQPATPVSATIHKTADGFSSSIATAFQAATPDAADRTARPPAFEDGWGRWRGF